VLLWHYMSEEPQTTEKGISRRQFLKVAAVGAGAGVLGKMGVDALLSSEGELKEVDLSNYVDTEGIGTTFNYEELVKDGFARELTPEEGEGFVFEGVRLDCTNLSGREIRLAPTLIDRIAQSNVSKEDYDSGAGWVPGVVGLYMINSEIINNSNENPVFSFDGDRVIHAVGGKNRLQNIGVTLKKDDWRSEHRVTPSAISGENCELELKSVSIGYETRDSSGLNPIGDGEAQVRQISQFARGVILQNTKDENYSNLKIDSSDIQSFPWDAVVTTGKTHISAINVSATQNEATKNRGAFLAAVRNGSVAKVEVVSDSTQVVSYGKGIWNLVDLSQRSEYTDAELIVDGIRINTAQWALQAEPGQKVNIKNMTCIVDSENESLVPIERAASDEAWLGVTGLLELKYGSEVSLDNFKVEVEQSVPDNSTILLATADDARSIRSKDRTVFRVKTKSGENLISPSFSRMMGVVESQAARQGMEYSGFGSKVFFDTAENRFGIVVTLSKGEERVRAVVRF